MYRNKHFYKSVQRDVEPPNIHCFLIPHTKESTRLLKIGFWFFPLSVLVCICTPCNNRLSSLLSLPSLKTPLPRWCHLAAGDPAANRKMDACALWPLLCRSLLDQAKQSNMVGIFVRLPFWDRSGEWQGAKFLGSQTRASSRSSNKALNKEVTLYERLWTRVYSITGVIQETISVTTVGIFLAPAMTFLPMIYE